MPPGSRTSPTRRPSPARGPKKEKTAASELAESQAKLKTAQEEAAALRDQLSLDTSERERAAIEETARLHERLAASAEQVEVLRASLLRMRATFASLSATLQKADDESGVALGALGLLEERVGGAGGADVALATLRAELSHCEWEISESKVGIGQAEETVALATMRGELRSVEAQLTATASLLSWARAARFTKSELRKGAAQEISLTDL